MSYDLAISENGDLIVTAHRDLAGISGSALIEQRIRTRLRLHRGQWVYDPDAMLGSQLYTLPGTPADRAQVYADAYVREALRGMDEISVIRVIVEPTAKDITVRVQYQLVLTTDDSVIPGDATLQDLSVSIPTAAIGVGE